uniref:Uncharacterized protein n=1 Tax=Setaria viridis TaxID=4556 RepID=A0A4U6WEB8_SETVI|nr:hypothetical protein SEVIR_1G237224v2 [Setaria viridis]
MHNAFSDYKLSSGSLNHPRMQSSVSFQNSNLKILQTLPSEMILQT